MAVTDPLGDMLTRIRNGQRARKDSVLTPASKLRARVLDVLQREGYIRGYSEEQMGPAAGIRIELKYFEGQPAIKHVARISKPGVTAERFFAVAADIAFALEHVEDSRAQLGRGGDDAVLAGLLAVADAGEHITQGIGQGHILYLTSWTS